jgi:prolyl oligopeptidase
VAGVSGPDGDARTDAVSGAEPSDPYLGLEEVTGERALAWVRERNAETLADLATGERFAAIRDGIREVLDSAEKLPGLRWRGEYLYNFWRDAAHPRGLWRRTTVDGVGSDTWEVLLDLDALAAEEGENWVWGGAEGLAPDYQRFLIHLSRGGADATVVREYDLTAGFLADGFALPEAKTTVGWIDIDHIFVGTDLGPGSLTESGYPRIALRWRRGTPLSAATTVFAGAQTDVSVLALHDDTPGFERDLVIHRTGFFDAVMHLLGADDRLTLVETPSDAWVDVHREWLLVRLRTPWTVGERTYAAGALLVARLAEYLAGDRTLTVLFEPAEPDALAARPVGVVLDYWTWTRHHLLVGLLRNVHSELLMLDPEQSWSRAPLPGVPSAGHTTLMGTNPNHTDELLITTADFTEPATLRYGTVRSGLAPLRQEPSFFDAGGRSVEQLWATSADGTRIPYFHLAGGDEGPVLLEAYGGFEVSRLPDYNGGLGRGWLQRGGGYVLANIRGGGEFGPQWHRAALRENRPRAFEDLAAVAADLVARGLTTPQRLGVTGGSNGGLLMGVMLTRYPALFGAIVGAVPLLDMLRYHRLLAGASWIAEYGDPDTDDRAFLRAYSPYQNVNAEGKYPPVLWITSTRDDRVHPGHARKMTALLRALGHRVAYYENIEGGHGAAADNEQAAFRRALTFEFLWRHLG